MIPPNFTYEDVEVIYSFFRDSTHPAHQRIIEKCKRTLQADPKFREPHK